jgi:VCBS repeat protein/ASPIC/UnbV protein
MIRLLLILLIPIFTLSVNAQSVIVQHDNNNPRGTLPDSFLKDGTEETAMIRPDGPCRVLELHVYYSNHRDSASYPPAAKDTLFIMGDPAEGAYPTTLWTMPYGAIASPIIFDYPGQEGWYTFDLRGQNIRSDGWDRITILHRMSTGGPFFTIDSDAQRTVTNSFIMDPGRNNSLGFPGAYSTANGNFCVRLLVEYDFPDGNTSQAQPAPALIDVTLEAGLTSGSGAVINSTQASVVDFNNDGLDDIAIKNNLFKNLGDGTFTDLTLQAGLSANATSWGDINNDGLIDVFGAKGWTNDKIYTNNGDGTFTDVTATTAIVNNYPTMTPIWFDYDNDGFIDLFIANNRNTVDGQEVYYPDQLWHNEGDLSFTNVRGPAGIATGEPAPYYDCYGASACDYNNDGWIDIFVANYRLAPDLLYRNNGDGTFTEVGRQTGVRGEPTAQANYFGHGMGCNWADYNNDGLIDLAVGNLGHPDWRGLFSNPSLIYENQGPPNYTFKNRQPELGLKFFEMNAGMLWADLNHDGYQDLWHGQISYRKEGDQGEPRRRNHIYINQGPPEYTLKDMTWNYGGELHGPWTAQRLDYDGDGDQDLLMCSSHVGVRLFRNDIPKLGTWAAFRITGKPSENINMDAYGTKLKVYAGGRMFFRELAGGGDGSRTTQSSNELHFGLGNASIIDSVVAIYTNGHRRVFTDLDVYRRYTIPYDGNLIVSAETPAIVSSSWDISAARMIRGTVYFSLQGKHALHNVNVDMFSLLGTKLGSITLGDLTPSQHSFTPSFHVPAGMYLLRLHSAEGTRTAKLIVTR